MTHSIFCSGEQAPVNLNREAPADKSFDDVLAESKAVWNK